MFAGAVFVVVVGGMVTLGRLALRNAVLSTQRTQAMNLAQEGIETVRQMRDTAWVDGILNPDAAKDWLAYTHNCYDPTKGAGSRTNYQPINPGVSYATCYDTVSTAPINQFGLMTAATDCTGTISPGSKADTCIQLVDENGKPDPTGPPWYRRTIRFEVVPNTANAAGFPGLQLLEPDTNNQPLLSTGIEQYQFINVVVTVEWMAFDRSWSINLETMLTNWRGR